MNVKKPEKNINTPEPNRFIKRIGSTTFLVSVYFDSNEKDSLRKKIKRLIRHEMEVETKGRKAANL